MVSLYILGEKGYKSLVAVATAYREHIDTIIIGSDKSVQDDFSERSLSFCKEHQLKAGTDRTTQVSSNYILAIGWRWLIQAQPEQTLIVLHDSILPRYRGFNPLVTALINGDSEIGVTALFGTEKYDEGDIIAIEKESISYPITIAQAINVISDKYATLVQKVMGFITSGTIPRKPQDKDQVSYSVWRDEKDYEIDWFQDANRIERFVNAVGFPYLGAQTKVADKKYTIVAAKALPDVIVENRTPGKVLFKEADKLIVICGNGLLRLDEVHDENGAVVTFQNKFRIRFE